MNRKQNLGLLTLLGIVLMTFIWGCRGYEDGPVVSFRSVQQRLFHDWWITSATVDGQDETQNIYQYVGLPEGPIGFSFSKASTGRIQLLVLSSTHGMFKGGECEWEDHRQILHFRALITAGGGFPMNGGWNVLRLTNREFAMDRYDSLGREWVLEMEGGEYDYYWN